MKKTWERLLLALLLCALLAGCGKKGMETAVTKPASSKPAVPAATEEAPSELPYQPGQMGVYVVTDPELEAAPEVLDSVHFLSGTPGSADRRFRFPCRCLYSSAWHLQWPGGDFWIPKIH